EFRRWLFLSTVTTSGRRAGPPAARARRRHRSGGGMKRRRWLYALPVVIFAALAAGFYYGLRIDSDVLPSALIDQPAPDFRLPPLPGHEPGFSSADLQGHVSLVNTFSS